MYFGADYYPEHVSPEAWERDAALMERAGFNVTRLAEFAWVFMEPEEGRFTFGWLDDAIATLFRHGIMVILGTPTASMPAWVARSHPESLAMDGRGRRLTWGARKNNCPSSRADGSRTGFLKHFLNLGRKHPAVERLLEELDSSLRHAVVGENRVRVS
jgi:beta-galactosidase